MTLTKKQVKAWLDTMSTDEVRPVFCGATVSKYQDKTVVITSDGSILAVLDAPELSGHEGKFISRDDVAKWHKLASNKDALTGETLAAMARETDTWFPSEWVNQVVRTPGAVEHIAFQAKYLLTMEVLASRYLQWQFGDSDTKPLIARADGNLYAVMPLK